MYTLVNDVGILIKQHSPGKLETYIFEMVYKDPMYLKTYILFDFLQVNVKDYGPMWVYAIRNTSIQKYLIDKDLYGEVAAEIHNRVISYLEEQYGYDAEQIVMLDHESNVYVN